MSRRRAERRGRAAESIAAFYLRLKGYRILGRRVRTPVGEVDIVARRRDALVFVEVKAHRDLAAADAALTPARLKRVGRAANFLLARYGGEDASVRIDAIVIRGAALPLHLKGLEAGDYR